MVRSVLRVVVAWLLLTGLGLAPTVAQGQAITGFGMGNESPVTVTGRFSIATADVPARLYVTARIKPGYHIYSITQKSRGTTPSEIKISPQEGFRKLGQFTAYPEPEKKIDPKLKGNPNVETHEGTVVWYAPIELVGDPSKLKIAGSVFAQPCTESSCFLPQDFHFTAVLGPPIPIPTAAEVSPPPSVASHLPVGEVLDPEQLRENTRKDITQRSLAWEMLLGFVGGIILNIMPCVLPVIGLKVLSFVEQSGHNRRQALLLNIWYSLGMIAVFLLLAGLAVTLRLGWGGLFQRPGFNVVMASVVFAMGLSFLGVWEIPIPGFVGRGRTQELAEQEGFAGAFLKGVITTVLATPCTGPYMGSALIWAVNQPAVNTFLVFASVGLGMASPYLLIGAFPVLIRFLPKPGAWMDTFKQIMGFILLGTVVYLLTFLASKFVVPTVGLLFALWAGLWWINRTPLTADFQKKLRAWMGALIFVGICWLVLFPAVWRPQSDQGLQWQPFTTREEFRTLLKADKTVLIDFTADWCPNCHWFEATVLDTAEVTEAMKKNHVVALRADFTHDPPEIGEMLDLLGGRQVPVIAVFSARRPNHPIVFHDGYTKQGLIKAIEQAVAK